MPALAGDVAMLGSFFVNVGPALVTVGKDVVAAAWNKDLNMLVKAKADFIAAIATAQGDVSAAQPAIDAISADFDTLIADMTP